MLWMLLTLAAALCWALTNLIDTSLLEHEHQSPLSLLCVTGLFGSLPMLAIFFWGFPLPSFWVLLAAFAAGSVGLFVYWPYFKALEKTHTTNVVLLWNLSPVFVVFAAWLFLGEELSAKEYVAVLFLIASSFLTSYDFSRSRIPRAASYWMIGASVAASVEMALLGFVFDQVPVRTGIVWVSCGIFLTTVVLILCNSSIRASLKQDFFSRRLRSRFVLNEGLDVAANLLRMKALALGPIGLVSAVGGLQPLFVFCLQSLFKSKQKPPSRVLALLAIILGMIGLALVA